MTIEFKNYRLVVGLGNPGPKYVDSRHNFGFICLEKFSKLCKEKPEWQLAKKKKKEQLAYWECWNNTASGTPTSAVLVWPLTYMNISGQGVAYVAGQIGCPPLEILVIVDDMSLALGSLRLRKKGSSGGHNGLKSIESLLGHQNYPRLRLGIGDSNPNESVVDFVLGQFSAREGQVVQAVSEQAAQAIERWLKGEPIERLMEQYNGWRYSSV